MRNHLALPGTIHRRVREADVPSVCRVHRRFGELCYSERPRIRRLSGTLSWGCTEIFAFEAIDWQIGDGRVQSDTRLHCRVLVLFWCRPDGTVCKTSPGKNGDSALCSDTDFLVCERPGNWGAVGC